VHTTNHLTASTTNADLGDGLLGLKHSNQHANLQPGGRTRADWPVWVADLCSKRRQPADVMGTIYIYVVNVATQCALGDRCVQLQSSTHGVKQFNGVCNTAQVINQLNRRQCRQSAS
jgi:hypothetical protein